MIRKLFISGLALAGLLGLAQIAAAQAPLADGPCPDACQEKVCHSVTETKTVTERKYDDTCEDYCRTKCSVFSLFTGGCDCADGNCGSVHTKKYLVIHFRKHDECVTKCVVGSATPACGTPVPMVAPPAQKPGELLPQPMPK